MSGLQGYLLVASPQLGESPFQRSVVLLLHHDENGAFGVVLNRPAEATIASVWQQISQEPCQLDRHVNLGGPVSGPMLALHTVAPLGEMEIPPGIFLAAERDHLEKLVHDAQSPLRLFIGHAGWGEGQLERELETGTWLTIPATPELVFRDEDDLWTTALKGIGRSVISKAPLVRHVPDDPSVN